MKKFFVLFLTLFASVLSANPYETPSNKIEQEPVDRCITPTDIDGTKETTGNDSK